ncbi:Alpha/Beta hydrolase fold [Elaphomyces granulatus]
MAINDRGFTVLVDPDNPIVDIVFVHGFTGHPKETWTRRAKGSRQVEVYWPRDLLPQTAPDARILTYGYDTKIRHFTTGPVSQNTVHDHGWEFLCGLEELRCNQPLRPLLLVAHSLGGLVVKEALRKSRDCKSVKPHLHNIVRSVVGVLFFGTPHRGANPLGLIRGTLTNLAKGFGFRLNDRIVDTLMPGGEHLNMNIEFASLIRQGKWIIYCFQEEYGLQRLLSKKVVDDESSSLRDPAIETKRHISSNHLNMCQFSGTEDPEYQKVAAAIKKVLQHLPTKIVGFRFASIRLVRRIIRGRRIRR